MLHEINAVDPDTGELITKNANFIQFYKDNIAVLDQIMVERPAAMRIIFWLIRLMDDQNAVITSQPAMCEALNLHRNTVMQAIKYLKTMKVLNVLKSGTSYVYAINNQIVWQDTADNKKFALFSAKVYVVASEQEFDFEGVKRSLAVRKKSKDRTSTKSMRTSKEILAA